MIISLYEHHDRDISISSKHIGITLDFICCLPEVHYCYRLLNFIITFMFAPAEKAADNKTRDKESQLILIRRQQYKN